jgi:hypothetical protein
MLIAGDLHDQFIDFAAGAVTQSAFGHIRTPPFWFRGREA